MNKTIQFLQLFETKINKWKVSLVAALLFLKHIPDPGHFWKVTHFHFEKDYISLSDTEASTEAQTDKSFFKRLAF